MSDIYLDQKLSNVDHCLKVDSNQSLGDSEVSSVNEEVRTIFVSGLPMDTKQRELYLLFRHFKGFQTATLKPPVKNGKPTAPVGFVTFQTRNQAENAIEKLEGVKFDPESEQLLRLDFARTNTKMTKNKMYTNHIYNAGALQNLTVGNIEQNILSQDMNLLLSYDGRIAFLAPSAFGPLGPSYVPLGGPFNPSNCTFAPLTISPNGGIINNAGANLPAANLSPTPMTGLQVLPQFLANHSGIIDENLNQVLLNQNHNGFLYSPSYAIGLNGVTSQPIDCQYNLGTWTAMCD